MKRMVSITVMEDDHSFTISRTVDIFWPGREDTPLMDILDQTVGETVKVLEAVGRG
jgi:hypothetical protein